MISDYVHPISTVKASDILREMIACDLRLQKAPTMEEARTLATEYRTTPEFLYNVWKETIDNHDTLNQRRCHP